MGWVSPSWAAHLTYLFDHRLNALIAALREWTILGLFDKNCFLLLSSSWECFSDNLQKHTLHTSTPRMFCTFPLYVQKITAICGYFLSWVGLMGWVWPNMGGPYIKTHHLPLAHGGLNINSLFFAIFILANNPCDQHTSRARCNASVRNT